MATNERDREVTFEIEEHLGVLSTSANGWSRELNLVSWNGNPAKYDIREWTDNHTRMRKGVTLTREELRELYFLLEEMGFEKEN